MRSHASKLDWMPSGVSQQTWGIGSMDEPPNNAFKPKLHRYAVNMAGTACHVASYALQFGLT
jgi:hypothetical protein